MRTSQSLAGLRRDWNRHGQVDPLWAVCVDSTRRGGRWDVAEFMATGRTEIDDVMTRLDKLDLCAHRDDALDFGCGVGRLTAALAGHFATVTGVDISPSMLDHARVLHADSPRCRFMHNDSADLHAFADDSFDLVYSSLVLQHMPPRLADAYLTEFVRIVRPDGAIVIVVPEAHGRTPRGLVYAYAPQLVVSWIQRAAFGYPAPMRMHVVPARHIRRLVEPCGAHLVASVPQPHTATHWRMEAHYLRVGAGSARPAGEALERP